MEQEFHPTDILKPGEANAFNMKDLFVSLQDNKYYDELYGHFTSLQKANADRDFNSFLREYQQSLTKVEERLRNDDLDSAEFSDLTTEKKELERVIAWLKDVLGMFN